MDAQLIVVNMPFALDDSDDVTQVIACIRIPPNFCPSPEDDPDTPTVEVAAFLQYLPDNNAAHRLTEQLRDIGMEAIEQRLGTTFPEGLYANWEISVFHVRVF